SSSSPSPSSHLTRHRQTFFFDRVLASSSNDDNSFINDKIQIPEKNCALIKNFTGIREWKIYKPLEKNKEDGGENKGYESRSIFQHPFNVLPIPGIHVGFSIRSVEKVEEENDLADISKLCRLLDKLFVLLDFNLKFDEKIQKPMMDLRFLWKYENQDIKIVKEEKELLFEQQHQKFKFIETLLTVPNDRVPPALNYSFNSVLSPNQTFHTNFHTTVKGDNDEIKGMEDEETCKLLFIHIIPNTFIVDKYQLDDSNDINDNKRIEIFGEMNLESPVGDKSLRWGNVAIINKEGGGTKKKKRSGVSIVSVPWPLVVCLYPLFSQTPLPLSLFYNNKRKQIKYILPIQQNHWPIELVKVPIGQLNHLKIVELWTILVVLIGSFWIFWTVSKKIAAKNAQDKNKID
ncbi:7288_t:CDS:2, partial [Entrophospora sp. SA101]